MSGKNPFKREYKSKSAITKCGYCTLEIKEENLENHCKTAHKKLKLEAGQGIIDRIIKTNVLKKTPTIDNATIDIDPTPSKSQKLIDVQDIYDENQSTDITAFKICCKFTVFHRKFHLRRQAVQNF